MFATSRTRRVFHSFPTFLWSSEGQIKEDKNSVALSLQKTSEKMNAKNRNKHPEREVLEN